MHTRETSFPQENLKMEHNETQNRLLIQDRAWPVNSAEQILFAYVWSLLSSYVSIFSCFSVPAPSQSSLSLPMVFPLDIKSKSTWSHSCLHLIMFPIALQAVAFSAWTMIRAWLLLIPHDGLQPWPIGLRLSWVNPRRSSGSTVFRTGGFTLPALHLCLTSSVWRAFYQRSWKSCSSCNNTLFSFFRVCNLVLFPYYTLNVWIL